MKLAQSLSSKEFAMLAGYYENLVVLLGMDRPVMEFSEKQNGKKLFEIDFRIDGARELYRKGEEVGKIIRAYVPDVAADDITMRELMSELSPEILEYWDAKDDEEEPERRP